MTTAIDELKTIITLSGSKRSPHLEEEIFANKELTALYLHNVCSVFDWYNNTTVVAECDSMQWSYCAFMYARHILGARWPVAEPLIATSPWWLSSYHQLKVSDNE